MSGGQVKLARKRLRWLWLNKGNGTLYSALVADFTSTFNATKSGTYHVSGSVGGVSHSATIAQEASPGDWATILEELITLYEESQAAGYTDETDIYQNMLYQLEPVTSYICDHSTMRDYGA